MARMSHVLIRELDPAVTKKLKLRARRHRRSLQAELKDVASAANSTDVLARIERIRAMFRRRRFSDSAVLIRRDRSR